MSLSERFIAIVADQRTRWLLSNGVKDILFNVVKNAANTEQANITKHAVEKGADLTDHVIDQPDEYNYTILLTDDAAEELDISTFTSLSAFERYNIIKEWKKDKVILTLLTYDEDIENLVIESITRKLESGLGEGISLDLKLSEVHIATSEGLDKEPVKRKGKVSLVSEVL